MVAAFIIALSLILAILYGAMAVRDSHDGDRAGAVFAGFTAFLFALLVGISIAASLELVSECDACHGDGSGLVLPKAPQEAR